MKNDDLIINRVRDLREDTDKTQEELAKELGVYTTTYARWERNPMSMKFPDIIRLAKHYKVSIDYIAGLTNEKRPLFTDIEHGFLFGSISNGKTQTAKHLQEILAEKLTEKD